MHTHFFMHTQFFLLAIFVILGFRAPTKVDDSPKGRAMQRMMELGTFGDERLKKRGPISWARSWPSAPPACVDSAAIGRRRRAFDVFCTTRR
jgi:hypothetical protein